MQVFRSLLAALAPSALVGAPLLLTNATIYTGNDAQARVQAVLAIDGRIAFVGAAAARVGGRPRRRSQGRHTIARFR